MKIKNFNFKLDKKSLSIIKLFQNISLGISLIDTLLMYIFLKYFISFDLYDISIIIFRTGLLAGIFSFCTGVIFNAINQKIIN